MLIKSDRDAAVQHSAQIGSSLDKAPISSVSGGNSQAVTSGNTLRERTVNMLDRYIDVLERDSGQIYFLAEEFFIVDLALARKNNRGIQHGQNQAVS